MTTVDPDIPVSGPAPEALDDALIDAVVTSMVPAGSRSEEWARLPGGPFPFDRPAALV